MGLALPGGALPPRGAGATFKKIGTVMELKEEMVSQQTVYEGIIVNVRRDKARLLDGRIANREVVEHPGGVAVLPWTGRARWRWSAQFRYLWAG